MNPPDPVLVCALYRFTPIPDPATWRDELLVRLRAGGILGTILVAPEGINGTVAGPDGELEAFLAWLAARPGMAGLEASRSRAAAAPFLRTRVKLKKEIVTLGVPGLDPAREAGEYVEPEDWNALVDDPGTLVIDTRNGYEVRVGRFAGALDPGTGNFRDFPAFVAAHPEIRDYDRVAMYCTGGIRCEKSTAYLRSLGLRNVCHLRGGILNYLEKIPAAASRWQGECFVFDERVTVDHALRPGSYAQCHACREPVTAAERADPRYRPGVSCPHCHDRTSEQDKARFAERERQVALAEERGESHIGPG